jgi:O-antigen/teichoic acid export membrane protein
LTGVRPAQPGRRRAAAIRLVFSYSTTLFVLINGIVLVPYYLRFFDLSTYGAWLASGNLIGLFGLLDAGLSTVVSQRLAQAYGAGDEQRFARLAQAGLFLFVLISAVIILAIYLIAPALPEPVKAPAMSTPALVLGIRLAAVGAALTLAHAALRAIPDAWQRTLFVGFSSLVSLIAGVITIVLSLEHGMGVAALGLGGLVHGAVNLLLTGAYVAWRWVALQLPRARAWTTELAPLLRTSAPIFLGRSISVVLANSEALIVAIFVTPVAAAVLMLTGRVFHVAQLVVNPIHGSVSAGIAHMAGSATKERQREVVREVLNLVGAMSAVVLAPAVALNYSFVGIWLGTERFGGLVLSALLCFSTTSMIQALALGTLMTALGELRWAGWITLIDGGLRLGLVAGLLPLFSIAGMPLASGLATSITFLIWFTVLRRYFSLRPWTAVTWFWPAWRGLALLLPAGVMGSFFLAPAATWLTFILRAVVIGAVSFGAALLACPLLREKARALRD